MKVVLVHEWLTNVAGSEKVLLQMAEIFPEAKIVVGVADPILVDRILPRRSVTSLLSPKLPGILTKWVRYAPLLWLAWRFVRIDADIILISSHFGAHQVCHRASGRTVVYYHTPMRIAWKFELEKDRVSSVAGPLIRRLLPIIQYFDKSPASKATVRLANSSETQGRLRDFYGCDSLVLHPPVSIRTASPMEVKTRETDYYLCLGRLVDYKRIDHAILACNQMGRRLVVAGTGPAAAYLKGIAGPTVEFVGQIDEDVKHQLLRDARALLFPGLEDFGIVPVEAMSYGTPVIALGQGGVLDTVTQATGMLYDYSDVESLVSAIQTFELKSYDADRIKRHATTFSEEQFRQRLRDTLGLTQETARAQDAATPTATHTMPLGNL